MGRRVFLCCLVLLCASMATGNQKNVHIKSHETSLVVYDPKNGADQGGSALESGDQSDGQCYAGDGRRDGSSGGIGRAYKAPRRVVKEYYDESGDGFDGPIGPARQLMYNALSAKILRLRKMLLNIFLYRGSATPEKFNEA